MRVTLELPSPNTVAGLAGMLEGLTRWNAAWLRQHPGTPRLYSGRVRYRREPPGRERWQTVPETLSRGLGDCEDLATWRAAELRLRGVAARAVPLQKPHGLWHIVVRLPNGRIEDPSRVLGMGA